MPDRHAWEDPSAPASRRGLSDGPPRILVTGATSGIGRGLAVRLGQRGWRVAVTGRREGLLQETAAQVTAGGAARVLE